MTNDPATTIGNFQLLRTLGEGGMGVVFEAEHVTMHRRAAIKVLRPELIRDEQAIRRFFNEARATNEIRHPGIVQIYDCGTRDDGSPWLIMELLEGETLSRRIARLIRVPAAEVIALGAQAASVLEAAHRAGIIHRDLKPDNLFIVNNQETPSGERVKVLDFGIAKLSSSAAVKSMHTQTGMLMGTPLYMSPEQCRGTGQVDARSDIYSFGLILYQMVAGELPFISEGMGELFDMQMNRPPPPLERKVPGVIPALAEVIYKALKKDPAERFQTMSELQRALLAVTASAASTSTSTATAASAAGGAAQPAAASPPTAKTRGLPVSNTTLSAGAMELDPLQVPRNPWVRPLATMGLLLVTGSGLFAARWFTRSQRAPAGLQAAAVKPTFAAGAGAGPAAVAEAPVRRPPAAAPAATRITVDIKSSPSEARIIDATDGHLIGVTPLHQTWERQEANAEGKAEGRGPLPIRVEKPGYLPKTLTVPRLQNFRASIKLERAEEYPPRQPRGDDDAEHIIKL